MIQKSVKEKGKMRAGRRIVHSRFSYGKPVRKSEPCDKVVTSCWSYDENTRVLTYGATVYSKTDKTNWKRKDHRLKAIERYEKNPCKIVLLSNRVEPKCVAIDWHIASEYIFKFGCEGKTGSVFLYDWYNEEFSYLKPNNKIFYTMDQLAKKYKFTLNEFRRKVNEVCQEEVEKQVNDRLEAEKPNHWLCLLSNVAMFGLCYLYFN